MSPQEILGRVLMQTEPEKARSIVSQFRNTLKNPKYVCVIHEQVQSVFADEDQEARKLIFIAVVYQLYQPLSYLRRKEDDKASGKLPTGVRDEMQRCLGVNNPETINALKVYVESPMKPDSNGVIRPFRQKVMAVCDLFKVHSIHADDTQFQLGF
jgi:hypothetical protein